MHQESVTDCFEANKTGNLGGEVEVIKKNRVEITELKTEQQRLYQLAGETPQCHGDAGTQGP